MTTRRARAFALLLPLTLLSAGCLEVEDEWVLNPDGTGKVHHKVTRSLGAFGQLATLFTNDADGAFVRDALEGSDGVRVWTDIRQERDKDGKITISATGYFRDVTKVRLEHSLMDLDFERGAKGVQARLRTLSEERTGSFLADLRSRQDLVSARATLRTMNMQLGLFTGKMSARTRLIFGGAIHAPASLPRSKDGGITLSLQPKELVKALNAVAKDDELLALMPEAARAPESEAAAKLEGAFNKSLYGHAGPVTIRGEGGPALFDYAKEEAAALKGMAQRYQECGLALRGPAGKPLTSPRVNAVEHALAEKARAGFSLGKGFRSHSKVHASFLLQGPAGLVFRRGRVTRAVGADGAPLKLSREGSRLEGLDTDSEQGGCRFSFAAPTRTPPASGYSLIEGEIDYLELGPETEVDLGLASFKKGSKGKRFGVVVKEREGNKLELTFLGVTKEQIKELRLEVQGQALAGRSYSYGMGATTATFEAQAPIPEAGKAILVGHFQPRVHRTTFALGPMDALGRAAVKPGPPIAKIKPPPALKPGKGLRFTALKVAGVTALSKRVYLPGVLPIDDAKGEFFPQLHLRIVGQLNKEATLESVTFLAVEAADGTELRLEEGATKEGDVSPLSLEPDKGEKDEKLKVSTTLRMPKGPFAGFRRVAGIARYTTSGAGGKTELGFKDLKVGSKGKALGAVVAKVKALDDMFLVYLELDAPHEDVSKILVLTPDDERTEFEDVEADPVKDKPGRARAMLVLRAPPPAGTKVWVTLRGEDVSHELPFEFRNLDPTGRQRK